MKSANKKETVYTYDYAVKIGPMYLSDYDFTDGDGAQHPGEPCSPVWSADFSKRLTFSSASRFRAENLATAWGGRIVRVKRGVKIPHSSRKLE